MPLSSSSFAAGACTFCLLGIQGAHGPPSIKVYQELLQVWYAFGPSSHLYNLIDQYRDLAKYNNGYAYNMMFVGPGWMNKMGRNG